MKMDYSIIVAAALIITNKYFHFQKRKCLVEKIQKTQLFRWSKTLLCTIVAAAAIVKAFVMEQLPFHIREYDHQELKYYYYFNFDEKIKVLSEENKDRINKLASLLRVLGKRHKRLNNEHWELTKLNTKMGEMILKYQKIVNQKDNQIENINKELAAKDQQLKDSDKWWFDEINEVKRKRDLKISQLLNIIQKKDSQLKTHKKAIEDKMEERKKSDELNQYKRNERERMLKTQYLMEQHNIELNIELEELRKRMENCNCGFGREDVISAEIEKEKLKCFEEKIQEQDELIQRKSVELRNCQKKLIGKSKKNQELSRKIKNYEAMVKGLRSREKRLEKEVADKAQKVKDAERKGLEQVEECRNVYEIQIARSLIMQDKMSEVHEEIIDLKASDTFGGNSVQVPPSSPSNMAQDEYVIAGKEDVFANVCDRMEKCLEQHKYKCALENLEILEERESCNPQIKVKKVQCLLHLGRELEAKQILDQLLKENDQDYDAICEMGFYHLSMRQIDKARNLFQCVLKGTRDHKRVTEGLACLSQQINLQRSIEEELNGHITKSLMLLNEATNKGSFFRWLDKDIYFRRGMINFQLTKYEAAINDFSRVLSDYSGHNDSIVLRAFSFVELGQFDEAHKDFVVLVKKGGLFKIFAQEAEKLKAMAPKGCPFKTLGLKATCYRHEIHRAHAGLLQKYQSDIYHQKDEINQLCTYIEFAKDLLLDDEKRSRYKSLLKSLQTYGKTYLANYQK